MRCRASATSTAAGSSSTSPCAMSLPSTRIACQVPALGGMTFCAPAPRVSQATARLTPTGVIGHVIARTSEYSGEPTSPVWVASERPGASACC